MTGVQTCALPDLALRRPPGAEEREVGVGALRTFANGWEKLLAAAGKADRDAAGRKALATFCYALMNSAGFRTEERLAGKECRSV